MKVIFKIVLMTVPFIAMGVGFVAYTIATKPEPAQTEIAERAIAVRFVTASATDISPRASGFGVIAPARSYEAIAQVTGTVEYVNPMLKRGEILPADAVLVRLSDSDYKLAAAQARANIRAVQARLAEIEVSESNLLASLEIEQESLVLKERELERLRQLSASGAASQAALDAVNSAYLAQRQKVQGLQNSLALLPTQRRVQTETIAVHQATLETAELNLARTELRLPFAARVGTVTIQIGQLVRSGQTIAGFDGIDAAEVEAQISASDMQVLFSQYGAESAGIPLEDSALNQLLGDISISADVVLKLGNEDVIWPATLDRISNTINQNTGTMGVFLRVDDAYNSAELGSRPPLTKGMFVEAVLLAEPVNGIAVPRSALRGGKIMLADAENRLRLVPVTVSFYRDRLAIITKGIAAGDKIIVSTPVPIIEGMLLELHNDAELTQGILGMGGR